MWTYEHSTEAAATAEAIWSCYQDVATWPEWNAAVGNVELDGPFVTGTVGRLSPPGSGPLPFKIVEATENSGYVSETEIAETVTLRSTNRLTPLPDGRTRIQLRVDLVGPAAEHFGKSFGPQLTAGVPKTVETLARRAEALAGQP
ncbi:SRPBCC family protein [Kribbella sp. NPDC050820]|uniref:SRPBCC family protein n=1 Tax=Kribbella sp. NPDC050820 TaxID=3155408 RepID=UPI0033C56C62